MIKKEFFISYAHEDEQIAAALARALRQIDDTFVVVNMDKVSLASGFSFRQNQPDSASYTSVMSVGPL